MNTFSCPRTCSFARERWCRFRPVLDALGPVRVDSETVRVKVEYSDPDTLRRVVGMLGGAWLGSGVHRLFDGTVTGNGFTLPGWQYPLVQTPDGLSYDDYHGAWGNVADLERLKGLYTLAKAEQAATAQGWQCERSGTDLVIHHPSGGTLTVTPGGTIDAGGFVGKGCHDAIMALGLPVSDATAKPEYSQVASEVQLPNRCS